jgi:spoIIIJ-associated protein
MEWVETTGRTVAEALDAALDELGVDEDDVEYEVMTEPRSGLFGRLGGSEARIRARVKPISREKPGDRRNRGGRKGGRGTDADTRRPKRGAGRSRSGDGASSRSAGGEKTEASKTRPARSRRQPRRTSGAASNDARTEQTMVEHSGGGEPKIPIDEQAEAAEEFARGLVEAFGVAGTVESSVDDENDTVHVDIVGDDIGLLVGPRGVTLAGIEELVRTVVQRHTGGHGARVYVDVGGYRAKRREALAEFTRGLVERVLDTGRDQALEPMSSSDRKVVHDTVSEIEGVTTASDGEEPRRRVVIRRA